MRVVIELSGSKGSKTFIGISFRACNSAGIVSTPLHFVDPGIYLRSRGCMVSIMIFQTVKDFDSKNALIREEFDTN
jgi:hypothetical protein